MLFGIKWKWPPQDCMKTHGQKALKFGENKLWKYYYLNGLQNYVTCMKTMMIRCKEDKVKQFLIELILAIYL
jgi:hypothetical protein